MQDCGEIVRALRWGGEPYRVLGPATAPLSRLKGEHRAQFFIKGTHRTAMREALQKVAGDSTGDSTPHDHRRGPDECCC